MSNIRTDFGRQIRILRREKNLTQEQLSESAGISVSFLSSIERGEKSSTLDTVELLAEALNIPVGQLLARCDNEPYSGRRELIYDLLTEYTEKILLAVRSEY